MPFFGFIFNKTRSKIFDKFKINPEDGIFWKYLVWTIIWPWGTGRWTHWPSKNLGKESNEIESVLCKNDIGFRSNENGKKCLVRFFSWKKNKSKLRLLLAVMSSTRIAVYKFLERYYKIINYEDISNCALSKIINSEWLRLFCHPL